MPYDAASVKSAWIYGLQQNAKNRRNLAMVNTSEIDDSSSTLEITLYDGTGESELRTRSVTLSPRRWIQGNGILSNISQGYVEVATAPSCSSRSSRSPCAETGVPRPASQLSSGAFATINRVT